MTSTLRSAWAEAWSDKRFRAELAATMLLLVGALATLTRFLTRVEERSGAVLVDPLLALFTPVDVNWVTFTLIYGALISGIVIMAREPRRLLLACQTYTAMVAVRMAAMWVTPLDPPATMIPLRDPTVYYLGTGVMLNKDLFFSGHTSTMFILFLTAGSAGARRVFLGATVAVGSCVLLQHTHYTIDVLAAPFFAYGAFRLLVLVRKRLFGLEYRGGITHGA